MCLTSMLKAAEPLIQMANCLASKALHLFQISPALEPQSSLLRAPQLFPAVQACRYRGGAISRVFLEAKPVYEIATCSGRFCLDVFLCRRLGHLANSTV